MGFFTQNIRQLIKLPPQEPIQDEEKKHPRKIGRHVFERTDPVRYDALNQLNDRSIAKGKEHRRDIGVFEAAPKGDREQECSKKIGDKVGDLIPSFPHIHPCSGNKGNDGQKDHPSDKKNVKLP